MERKPDNKLWLLLVTRVRVGQWGGQGLRRRREAHLGTLAEQTSQMERDTDSRACNMEEGSEKWRDVDVSEEFRD